MNAGELGRDHYAAVSRALEICDAAASVDELRHLLMHALHEEFGLTNTTFLSGPTFRQAFADPDPVTTGAITGILDEYQANWYTSDVFALPEAFERLGRRPAISHQELRSLPADSRTYLEDFLYRHRLRFASVAHLTLPHGHHAVVGMFDREHELTTPELHSVALLARHVSLLAEQLPTSRQPRWDDGLSPRLREVSVLVAEGFTNEEIAAQLVLSPESIKKYLSRVFELTGCRNRAELVRHVLLAESSQA